MAPDPDWDGVMKHRARELRAVPPPPIVTWRDAEEQLSQAYVRLRKILGAFETPEAPTGPQVWEHTEQCARELVTALRAIAEAGQCCEAAEVGRPHDVWCLAAKALRRIDRFGGSP